MPKLSKNKAARAQYRAKLKANREAKEKIKKAEKEAAKPTEREKKDRQNELARQRRAKKKTELAKQLQRQQEKELKAGRKSQIYLPYDTLLHTTLITYLLTRTITGKGQYSGIRETALNLATKIGLYNTKFYIKEAKSFMSTYSELLLEFFAGYVGTYSKENNEFFITLPKDSQNKAINAFLGHLVATFSTTKQYFSSNHRQYVARKITSLTDSEGKNTNTTVPALDLKMIYHKEMPKEYYTSSQSTSERRALMLVEKYDDAILLTQSNLKYYNNKIEQQCKLADVTIQQYYFGKITAEQKNTISNYALLGTIMHVCQHQPEIARSWMSQSGTATIVDCKFFKERDIKPYFDLLNKRYFTENLPTLVSYSATRNIIDSYKRFMAHLKNTKNKKYHKFDYYLHSRTYTLSETTVVDLNKTFYLLLLILFIFPAPSRRERKYADLTWGNYFFTLRKELYQQVWKTETTEGSKKLKTYQLKNAQINIDTINKTLSTLSKMLTPIFFPLDFIDMYQGYWDKANDSVPNPPGKISFKKAQELLIQNVVTIEGDNLFTEIIYILEDLSTLIDKFIAKEQNSEIPENLLNEIKPFEGSQKNTKSKTEKNQNLFSPQTSSTTALHPEINFNPYPEIDW